MTFNNWIDTFLEEKGIDLEETFEFETVETGYNLMPYAVVVEFIKFTSRSEQEKIKNMLVQIDFKNGDVKHFLRYLGKGLAI